MKAHDKPSNLMSPSIIDDLYNTILSRKKTGNPETSYSALMFSKGINKIAQKVGEEGVEVAIAAVSEGQDRLVEESADLIYMILLLWAAKGVHPSEVYNVLKTRSDKK
jgi:phosphoribosyl-ATP pyrophosphohydrolase